MATSNPFVGALAGNSVWDNPLNLDVFFDTGAGGSWTQQEMDLFVSALLSWARVANVGFNITFNKSNAELIESKETNATWLSRDPPETPPNAEHNLPGGQSFGRYNTSQPYWNANDLVIGGTFFSTMVHELGHALGLDHPHQDPGQDALNFPGVTSSGSAGDNNLNNRIFSVMSYVRNLDAPQDNFGHVATPMAFDIAAIQYLYGANMGANSEDTTYELKDNSSVGNFYSCIWDVGGTDEIVYNGASAVTIDLRPATLQNEVGGGGRLSQVNGITAGFTIAGDFTNRLANIGTTSGVIIENARGGSGNDTITGNSADNNLRGGDGADTIDGADGNDSIFGDGGADTLNGGLGNDEMQGGLGIDHLIGGAGNDTLYQADSNFNSNIGDGADILEGGDGNDRIYGDLQDTMHGEAGGDDVFLLGAWTSADIKENLDRGFVSGGTSFNSFGPDLDTLWLTNIQRSVLDIVLGRGFTVNILDGGFETGQGSNGNDVLGGKTLPAFTIELNPQRFSLYGNGGNDILNGNGAINYLDGGTGNDTLLGYSDDDRMIGGDGNDELRGGAGTDSLAGQQGDDVIYCDYSDFQFSINQQAVYVNGGAGHDKVYVEGVQGVVINLGSCEFEEAYGGDGSDTFDASTAMEAVIMDGKGGADALTGSIYDDKMTDTGFDTGDVFDGNAGRDSVSYTWFQGGINFDADYYDTGYGRVVGIDGDIGTDQILSIEIIYGGDGANIMSGGSLNTANEFVGGANADQLYGGGGNDILRGGLGADQLYGETGEDFFYGGRGNDTFNGGSDYDTVYYTDVTSSIQVTYTASGSGTVTGVDTDTDTFVGIELMILGSGNDVVQTSSGSESVDLGAGNDVLKASAGIDLYTGGAGIDTLDYSFATVGLVMRDATITTAGGEIDYIAEFENFTGGSGADDIEGNIANNILNGGGGQDKLVGGVGADTLNGGNDRDTADYATSALGVAINLAVAGAQQGGDAQGDVLISIENVNGSAKGDILIGDGIANVLNGGAGNDLLVGGLGQDTLNGGADLDTVDYSAYVNGVSINLATGAGADGDLLQLIENAIGSAFGDVLAGDAGANTMRGGSGNDFLVAGNGADFLDGGADLDTVSYATATTGVLVNLGTGTGANGGVLANIENILGSNFGDVLYGDNGANTINGGAGNDYIVAGNGADNMIGGSENDTVSYETATTGVSANLQTGSGANGGVLSQIENLTGSAFGDVLTGDAGSNTIKGGAGNDFIVGGAGSDALYGGADADIFRYAAAGYGGDVIVDFQDGLDKLSFATSLASSFSNFTVAGNGTTSVTLTLAGQAIVVQGAAAITLGAADFLFV